jgi:acetyl esterase
MPLNQQCAALIKAVEQAGNAFEASDIEGARAAYRGTIDLYVKSFPDMARVRNRVMPAMDGGNIPVRIYNPRIAVDVPKYLPVLVFFHGGGFALGDLDTHDCVCRELAHRASCVVVAVDYRLAPEYPFPIPVNDCLAALTWVSENAEAIGCDHNRIAIGGDSAGGNLAAVVARRHRDRNGHPLALQLLIYPTTDFAPENQSIEDNAEGYLLTKAAIEHFRGLYLEQESDWMSPYASPLRAEEFENLSPAFVMTAEFDPLRDEGRDYVEKLKTAQVPAKYQCYDGMIHGFIRMGGLVDDVTIALDDAAMALRKAFAS